jgi:hypothetical protein
VDHNYYAKYFLGGCGLVCDGWAGFLQEVGLTAFDRRGAGHGGEAHPKTATEILTSSE